jgi:hypothetical protein
VGCDKLNFTKGKKNDVGRKTLPLLFSTATPLEKSKNVMRLQAKCKVSFHKTNQKGLFMMHQYNKQAQSKHVTGKNKNKKRRGRASLAHA